MRFVRQRTILKDKNNKDIYTGDILRCVNIDNYTEKYGDVFISIGKGNCIDENGKVVYAGYGICLTTEKTGETCLVDVDAFPKYFEITGSHKDYVYLRDYAWRNLVE